MKGFVLVWRLDSETLVFDIMVCCWVFGSIGIWWWCVLKSWCCCFLDSSLSGTGIENWVFWFCESWLMNGFEIDSPYSDDFISFLKAKLNSKEEMELIGIDGRLNAFKCGTRLWLELERKKSTDPVIVPLKLACLDWKILGPQGQFWTYWHFGFFILIN